MAQEVRCVRNRKRLVLGMDAVFVAAVQFLLAFGIRHPDAPIRCFHDVERCPCLSKTVLKGKHVGIHAGFDPVVRFHNGDPGASSFGEASIARGAIPLVLLIDDFHAVVVGGIALHDGKRIIGAAVVEQDDFQAIVRLPDDAVQALLQIGACVVYRHDNRYKRFAHVRPLIDLAHML